MIFPEKPDTHTDLTLLLQQKTLSNFHEEG